MTEANFASAHDVTRTNQRKTIEGTLKQNCTRFYIICFFSVEDLQAECQSATAQVFRYQKVLQGTSFSILAKAVSKSPSVLGALEDAKTKTIAELSGTAWPIVNPKVLRVHLIAHI